MQLQCFLLGDSSCTLMRILQSYNAFLKECESLCVASTALWQSSTDCMCLRLCSITNVAIFAAGERGGPVFV